MQKTRIAFLVLAALTASTSAPAQEWEFGQKYLESGEDIVVENCGSNGFATVGWSNSRNQGVSEDSYVVFSDNSGGAVAQYWYDVGGLDWPDSAVAIVPAPDGGYYVAGTTIQGTGPGVTTPAAIYLMRIDCSGKWQWVRVYHGPWTRAEPHIARDLVLLSNGDLVIAGMVQQQHQGGVGPEWDALLIRVNPAGVALWGTRYETGGDEWFNSVTANSMSIGGSGVGDIIAVGAQRNLTTGRTRALVTRFNAAGTIAAGAVYGSTLDNQELHAVEEVTVGKQTGDNEFIAAGYTDKNGGSDVYLLRFNVPALPLAQNVLTLSDGNDVAYDLKEAKSTIKNSGLGINMGEFLVVGEIKNHQWQNLDEAFLFPVTVALVANAGFLFGDGTPDVEMAKACALFGANTWGGAALAGQTQNTALGDPMNLYLVRTNADLQTACSEKRHYIGGDELEVAVASLDAETDDLNVYHTLETLETSGEVNICDEKNKREGVDSSLDISLLDGSLRRTNVQTQVVAVRMGLLPR